MNYRIAKKISGNHAHYICVSNFNDKYDYFVRSKEFYDALYFKAMRKVLKRNKMVPLSNALINSIKKNAPLSRINYLWSVLKKYLSKTIKIDSDAKAYGFDIYSKILTERSLYDVPTLKNSIITDIEYYSDRWCDWRIVVVDHHIKYLNDFLKENA